MVAVGVGGQACLLVLNMFSSFLSGMDRDGALCSRGCMIDLGGLVSSECVDASHNFYFHFNIHSFYW